MNTGKYHDDHSERVKYAYLVTRAYAQIGERLLEGRRKLPLGPIEKLYEMPTDKVIHKTEITLANIGAFAYEFEITYEVFLKITVIDRVALEDKVDYYLKKIDDQVKNF